jgi:hypothetical protein
MEADIPALSAVPTVASAQRLAPISSRSCTCLCCPHRTFPARRRKGAHGRLATSLLTHGAYRRFRRRHALLWPHLDHISAFLQRAQDFRLRVKLPRFGLSQGFQPVSGSRPGSTSPEHAARPSRPFHPSLRLSKRMSRFAKSSLAMVQVLAKVVPNASNAEVIGMARQTVKLKRPMLLRDALKGASFPIPASRPRVSSSQRRIRRLINCYVPTSSNTESIITLFCRPVSSAGSCMSVSTSPRALIKFSMPSAVHTYAQSCVSLRWASCLPASVSGTRLSISVFLSLQTLTKLRSSHS